VGNGDGSIVASTSGVPPQIIKTKVLWEPAVILFFLMIIAFWLGSRYSVRQLRIRMESGLPPVKH
jgi:hypothetical protein